MWVSHPDDAWIVGTVRNSSDKIVEVMTEKRGLMKLDPKTTTVESCGDHLDLDIDNLVDLDELSEGAILHHVRKRFAKRQIYTFVGPILVAVNPFERLPIYEPTDIRQAKSHATLYPHVFVTAAMAYKQLDENKKSQSCLISGESGAGKTETTKKVLTYLAAVAPGVAAAGEAGIEERILMSNPLLEALGNAKTLRNNNSSRFGKYIKLEFNRALKIRGCEMVNYLLEKSRVVTQNSMERNYHMFYQLLSTKDTALKEQLFLMEPSEYAYLNTSGCITIPGVSDPDEFAEVQHAMTMLKIDSDTSMSMFKLISAVLLLGNVNFKPNPAADTESILDPGSAQGIRVVADLLQVDEAVLVLSLTSKNMMVGRENVTVKFNTIQAMDSRDTLAKTLYSNMFDLTVQTVNKTLASEEAGSAPFYIGILDIFGFEIFEKNSFEQLCINYANEKLQFHFNSVIFGQEMLMYELEGIALSAIEFVDNARCVELIEGKPFGLISLLEEECSLGGGKDSSYISKVEKSFGKGRAQANVHFVKHKTKPTIFSVNHFAGAVEYSVDGWLDKNRDTMSPTLKQTMSDSESPFIAKLFVDVEAVQEASPTKAKSNKSTLGTQFRQQLISLLASLEATEPHFVRCVKPNHAKVGGVIEPNLVLGQMRYSGLFEAIRIRKSGFAYRASHEQFANTYKLLADDVATKLKAGSMDFSTACKSIIKTIISDGVLAEKVAVCGATRVFLKNNSDRSVLDRQKRIRTEKYAVKIQSLYRMHLAYMACNKIKWELGKEQRRIRAENDKVFRLCLLVQSAFRGKTARKHVQMMQPIVSFRRALRSRDIPTIQAAIELVEANTMGLLDSQFGKDYRLELKAGKKMCILIEMQHEFLAKLDIALEGNDLEELQGMVFHATSLELQEHVLVEKAESKLRLGTKQLAVMKKMVIYLQTSEHTSFDPRNLLEDARELGVDEEFIGKVKRVYQNTGPLLQAKFSIRRAIETVDKFAVKRSIDEIVTLQKFHPHFCEDEVAAGLQLLKMISFQKQICVATSAKGGRSRTSAVEGSDEEKSEKDGEVACATYDELKDDDGPRLTPSTLDLCEVICCTDDISLARKAQSRLTLMTRNTEQMEDLVRCFKWSKLLCTWNYPENAAREAKDSGTMEELLSRRKSVAMGLIGASSEGGDAVEANVNHNKEFDFFTLRAADARKCPHLTRVLQPTKKLQLMREEVAETQKDKAARTDKVHDAMQLPDGVEEIMHKLEAITGKQGKIDKKLSGLTSSVEARGVFSTIHKEVKATKQQAMFEKLSERSREGAILRRTLARKAFDIDRTSTLVPPSPTRVLQPAKVKALPASKYGTTISREQELKLIASRKAAEKQQSAKKAAFAHLDKVCTHKFKI